MASFVPIASKRFPGVEWTGMSDKHVSVAQYKPLPISMAGQKVLIATLVRGGFTKYVEQFVLSNFKGIEWVLEPEEFHLMGHVDFYNYVMGMPPMNSAKQFRNPKTKSIYHPFAFVDGKWVMGIRYWVAPNFGSKGHSTANFRIRIQAMNLENSNAQAERAKVRERYTALEPAMAKVQDLIADVPVKQKELQHAYQWK